MKVPIGENRKERAAIKLLVVEDSSSSTGTGAVSFMPGIHSAHTNTQDTRQGPEQSHCERALMANRHCTKCR